MKKRKKGKQFTSHERREVKPRKKTKKKTIQRKREIEKTVVITRLRERKGKFKLHS